jgi:hypothetical protein
MLIQEVGVFLPLEMQTIADVHEMVTWELRLTFARFSEELNNNKETIRQILLQDLQKKKFVPQKLTDEQKQRQLKSCLGFSQTCQDNFTFLDCIFFFLR